MDRIEYLREQFGKLQTIDPASPLYRKLISLLDQCDDKAIVEVANAKIKFVSNLALIRALRRKLI